MRTLLIWLILASNGYLFANDVIDKITLATCECVNSISDSADLEGYQMQLGLCILKEAQPYKAALKKSYKLDLDKISTGEDNGAETLGEMVGMRMATTCPKQVERMAEIMKLIENGEGNKATESSISKLYGKVVAVEKEQFITLLIEEQNGKRSRALWLEYFTNSNILQKNLDNLVGKEIELEFSGEEIYDHRVGEYVSYKVIKNLVSLEE